MPTNTLQDLAHFTDEQLRNGKVAGFRIEGPSKSGSFLVMDRDGKTWVLGRPNRIWGRGILPSVWTPLNVAVMRQESTEGL